VNDDVLLFLSAMLAAALLLGAMAAWMYDPLSEFKVVHIGEAGELVPFGHGLVWRYYDRLQFVSMVVPLNVIVRGVLLLYWRLQRPWANRTSEEWRAMYVALKEKEAEQK